MSRLNWRLQKLERKDAPHEKISAKPIEEMTDEELQIHIAAGSEELALELTETGKINRESLERVAGLGSGSINGQ